MLFLDPHEYKYARVRHFFVLLFYRSLSGQRKTVVLLSIALCPDNGKQHHTFCLFSLLSSEVNKMLGASGSESSGRGSESSGRGSESSGRGSESSGRGSESSGRGSESTGRGSESTGRGSESTGRGSESTGRGSESTGRGSEGSKRSGRGSESTGRGSEGSKRSGRGSESTGSGSERGFFLGDMRMRLPGNGYISGFQRSNELLEEANQAGFQRFEEVAESPGEEARMRKKSAADREGYLLADEESPFERYSDWEALMRSGKDRETGIDRWKKDPKARRLLEFAEELGLRVFAERMADSPMRSILLMGDLPRLNFAKEEVSVSVSAWATNASSSETLSVSASEASDGGDVVSIAEAVPEVEENVVEEAEHSNVGEEAKEEEKLSGEKRERVSSPDRVEVATGSGAPEADEKKAGPKRPKPAKAKASDEVHGEMTPINEKREREENVESPLGQTTVGNEVPQSTEAEVKRPRQGEPEVEVGHPKEKREREENVESPLDQTTVGNEVPQSTEAEAKRPRQGEPEVEVGHPKEKREREENVESPLGQTTVGNEVPQSTEAEAKRPRQGEPEVEVGHPKEKRDRESEADEVVPRATGEEMPVAEPTTSKRPRNAESADGRVTQENLVPVVAAAEDSAVSASVAVSQVSAEEERERENDADVERDEGGDVIMEDVTPEVDVMYGEEEDLPDLRWLEAGARNLYGFQCNMHEEDRFEEGRFTWSNWRRWEEHLSEGRPAHYWVPPRVLGMEVEVVQRMELRPPTVLTGNVVPNEAGGFGQPPEQPPPDGGFGQPPEQPPPDGGPGQPPEQPSFTHGRRESSRRRRHRHR